MYAIPIALSAFTVGAFVIDGLFDRLRSAISYEQTPESRTVFATADELDAVHPSRIMSVVRGDLLHMKLCQDFEHSVYCSALRLSNVGRTEYPGPFPPRSWKSVLRYHVEEIRFCVWEGGAVGIAMGGAEGGDMHEALVEQYPGEMASMVDSPYWQVGTFDLMLNASRSLASGSVRSAIRAMGLEDRFPEVIPGFDLSDSYPPQELSKEACRRMGG